MIARLNQSKYTGKINAYTHTHTIILANLTTAAMHQREIPGAAGITSNITITVCSRSIER